MTDTNSKPLTAERLREVLCYDPDTGVFTWIKNQGRVKSGSIAGYVDKQGYVALQFCGAPYRAHRLAWLYVHGTWPTDQIDHRNRIKDDNRISNLREATDKQNRENQSIRRDNKSGYRGISWFSKARKWTVYIGHYYHSIYLGLFENLEDAVAARAEAERRLFTYSEHLPPPSQSDLV